MLKVETTTRGNENGTVEFKTNTSHNLATEKLGANVDVKYKIPQHGNFVVYFIQVLMNTLFRLDLD